MISINERESEHLVTHLEANAVEEVCGTLRTYNKRAYSLVCIVHIKHLTKYSADMRSTQSCEQDHITITRPDHVTLRESLKSLGHIEKVILVRS